MSLCECTENHLPGHQGGPVCTTFFFWKRRVSPPYLIRVLTLITMRWSKFAFKKKDAPARIPSEIIPIIPHQ